MSNFVPNAIHIAAIIGVSSFIAASGAIASTGAALQASPAGNFAAHADARAFARQQKVSMNASGCTISRMQVKGNQGVLVWKLVEDCNLD